MKGAQAQQFLAAAPEFHPARLGQAFDGDLALQPTDLLLRDARHSLHLTFSRFGPFPENPVKCFLRFSITGSTVTGYTVPYSVKRHGWKCLVSEGWPYICGMPKKSKLKLMPVEFDKNSMGKRLARIRKERGLTQNQVAARTGLTQVLVSDYERGRLRLAADMAVRFAVALGITTDELLRPKVRPAAKNQPQGAATPGAYREPATL